MRGGNVIKETEVNRLKNKQNSGEISERKRETENTKSFQKNKINY